jgi:elongator complex protein 3
MRSYDFNPQNYQSQLVNITLDLLGADLEKFPDQKIDKILKKYPKDKSQIFSRDQIISGIRFAIEHDLINRSHEELEDLISKIKMKPMRTESGVSTVTVLSKPFACPGQCIFCPNDVRMPKSYIATEPGAQRALMNKFSPYGQVFNRLQALKNIGHPTDKIELLILGGTWSYYPKKYQIWFIHECFRAMNNFSNNQGSSPEPTTQTVNISEELQNDFNDILRDQVGNKPYNQLIQTKEFKDHFEKYLVSEDSVSWEELLNQQEINSHGACRCVGLVLETRPDAIDEKEVYDLRKLGATKIQIGIQTLDDRISHLNKRGETHEDTKKAFKLLRAGGFKIHAHMMPNLLGATPKVDFDVYKELFENPAYKPDELKIYPTSIIKHTELYDRWQTGEYQPYSTELLIDLISSCMEVTPEYCRITRVIRDIPSTEIADGNLTTNLREVVEHKLKSEDRANPNIRAREIRNKKVSMDELILDILEYETEGSREYFLQYITSERLIAGFLRLSLPKNEIPDESKSPSNTKNPITSELDCCAIIREVHVYGPSLQLKRNSSGEAQHLGLGTKLIEKSKQIASEAGFQKLAVISSIGTREYYQKRGFELKELYQIAELDAV